MQDEMCGMYIYYYGENGELLDRGNCETTGPPAYTWASDPLIGRVPPDVEREASLAA